MLHRVPFRNDFDSWRLEARRLLAEAIPPEAIEWQPDEPDVQGLLFGAAPSEREGREGDRPPAGSSGSSAKPLTRVPRAFLDLARKASCHRDPTRWALLYRLLWRMVRAGENRLLQVEVDPDVHPFRRMVKAVRRDLHKMHAFVRFRRFERMVDPERGESETWYGAWYRPDHYIVPLAAPFFVERFNDQRWSILTPDGSAHWNLEKLEFGPGVPRSEAPGADELEDLWRTYYASIFNPARANERAMKAELPTRHWATLPEADLIPGLLRDARRRRTVMIETGEAQRAHRPPAREWIAEGADLSDLSQAISQCRACSLCENGTRPVFGEGPAMADLMLVGEQPGDREEEVGRPFVGPAGERLNATLQKAGLDRGQLYLTNGVKHFRFEERSDERGVRRIHKTPSLAEVQACRPWLAAEIDQINPRGIVALGATATRSVLGPAVQWREVRGQFQEGADGTWILPTHHPASMLRHPDPERRAEIEGELIGDLTAAAERMGGMPTAAAR